MVSRVTPLGQWQPTVPALCYEVGKLNGFKHGIKENACSIVLALAMIIAVLLLWRVANSSVIIFCIAVVGVILCSAAFIVYDAKEGPIFDWNLSGFSIQAAPVFASSFISGWSAHKLLFSGRAEELQEAAVILLVVSLMVTLSSLFNISESAFRPEKAELLEQKRERRWCRIKLTVNLLLVHGVFAVALGVLTSWLR